MNTYGDIGNATAGYYSRRLLSHAMPTLILEMFAQTRQLPKNETKIIQFRRSKPFSPATTPLTEGVTPNGSDFGYDTITAQIQQYGDYSVITDVIQDTSKDMVLRDISERQGEQIGETREALMWDILRAGTNVSYGGAAGARNAISKTSVLDHTRQRSVTTALEQQKAKKFTKILRGSPNYQTWPIEAAYIAVCHTNLKPTIRDLKGVNVNDVFTPTSKYGSSMKVVSPHEVGSFEDVRYIASADLDPFAGAGANVANDADANAWRHTTVNGTRKYDVYPVLVFGREAYGCIPLRGKRAVRPMVVNPKPQAGDPLAQRGSAGWKMWFACVILNEAWLRRLEIAAPK